VIDTWILAQLQHAGTGTSGFGSEGPSPGHFGGREPTERTYVDASQITRLFSEAPETLMAYAGDDAVETLAIGAIWRLRIRAGPDRTLRLSVDARCAARRRRSTRWWLREYLARGPAVRRCRTVGPVGRWRTGDMPGASRRPVLHVDVTSLYPR
jgi:hypothetical protein